MPDIHGIALTALFLKMACAVLGIILGMTYLRFERGWSGAVQHHAVHDDCVALTGEGQERFQLRALGVFPRRLIGERPVHLDMLKLPLWVLLERTDPDVTDALTLHVASPRSV